MRRARRVAILAAAAALALAGHAGPAAAQDCPEIALVPEVTRLTQFRDGPGRTLDDIRYDIIVRGTSVPVCRNDDRRITMTMRINFDTLRGRAAAGSRVQFSYFVAIVHRGTREIVAKEVFPVAFDFPQNRSAVVIEEEMEQIRFRLKKDEEPYYYAILVGLQLTEEQLAYNRTRRGEAPGAPSAAAPGRDRLPTLPGLAAPGAQAPAPQTPAPQQAAPRGNLPSLPKAN